MFDLCRVVNLQVRSLQPKPLNKNKNKLGGASAMKSTYS